MRTAEPSEREAPPTMAPTTQHPTDRDTVADVEIELSLLARHQLHSTQHAPDRALDRSGYALLGRLEHGAMSLRQLAEAFRLDQSTVNRQINALRRDHLVERVSDPDGGVAHLLRPTRRGLALLHRDRVVARRQLGQVLDGWDAGDIARLHELLERLNTSIERLEGRPWPRG